MPDTSPTTSELVEMLRAGTEHLVNMARGFEFPFDPGVEDLRRRHTMYVRNLVAAYVSKFAELSVAIIDAIAKENYLTYAVCGRALVETTALLRYYVTEEYEPLLATGELGAAEMQKLLEIDERHLRGSHFDWQSFLFENYSKMQADAIARLRSKKGKGPPRPPGPKQPRIGGPTPVSWTG